MKLKHARIATLVAITFALCTVQGLASTLYSQPYDGMAHGTASQNDTGGGFGLFAVAYDNFTLAGGGNITGVNWVGINYGVTITGFTIQIWADNAGQPGASVYSQFVAGNAGEASLGADVYSYSAALSGFLAGAGTQYWLSIVPDATYPPQWFWASGTGGDNQYYLDFLGTRYQYTPANGCNSAPAGVECDLNFELTGDAAVPEPASLVLLGTGLLGLARKFRKA